MKNRAKVDNGRAKKTEIKVYDISILGAEQMCEFIKLCYERNCQNIMTNDAPIGSNLCDHCKPKGGKSIDFFNFFEGRGADTILLWMSFMSKWDYRWMFRKLL